MFKKMSLKVKLIALFLLVGLIPVAVISVLSYNNASREINDQVVAALNMYAAILDDQLDDFFAESAQNAVVIATTRDVYQSMNILRDTGWDTGDPEWWARTAILEDLSGAMLDEMPYSLIYITDPDAQVIFATDQGFMGDDLSDRAYIRNALQGRTDWSELFYSHVVNENVMAVAAPIRSGGRSGEILGTVNLTLNGAMLDQLVHNGLGELGQTADAYLVSENGLLYTNTRLGQYRQGAALNQSINTRAVELLAPAITAGNLDFYAQEVYPDYMGNPVLGALEVTMMGGTPRGLVVEIDEAEAFAGVQALQALMISIAAVSALVMAGVAFVVAMSIVRPVQAISDLTRELAGGDFTVQAEIKSQDEVGQMAGNLNRTIQVLSDTLTRVQQSSDSVTHASGEISSGNQDLSQRTEEQASSLEEVSSTVEEIASSLEASSANAAEADRLSNGTMDSVRRGESVVTELQGAMEEITRGSQEISEIISTVNDIAFQTNLLALNAAVEAARAGEQGRGFAVVAAEVRNLAGRSADSAKEIEKLIKDSIVRVEKGNSLMTDTGEVLKDIINNTQKTSDVVGEIAASLREQATAAGDIRTAIEELNQVTQQNASLVEEIASSSENMSAEAADLSEQVSFFKLAGQGQRQVAARAAGGNNRDRGNGKKNGRGKLSQAGKALAQKAAKVTGARAQEEDDDFPLDENDFEKF